VQENTPADRRLIAYVVLSGDRQPGPAALRGFLAQQLPVFMVPNLFVTVPAIPVLPNGKVDRRALPPADDAGPRSTAYVEPTTATERTVVQIWAETLGVDRVGLDDNFFDLGGHSLLATQVVSRARQAFGLEIPITLLFESATPRRFAADVDLLSWATESADRPEGDGPQEDGRI